jgi:formate dehydrogenase subunit delta
MNTDNLVRMVNRIGAFFEAMPDRDEALEGIAQHVRRYWEPRMRQQLLAHLDATEGAGLDPVVLTALRQHRAVVG